MASIRITQFGGLLPEISARLKPITNAQVAHNCLLTDGTLRPQAKWVSQGQYDAGFEASVRGVAYDRDSDTCIMYRSFDPVTLTGAPFAAKTTVGASPNSLVNRYVTGRGFEPRTVAVYGDGVSGTITYQRSYDSNKPVNRMYAVSRVRRIGNNTEEGILIPITSGQNPTDLVYEGDLVTVRINASALDDDATHVRLYRSVSGLDTGQSIANDLDTNWHLVDELPLIPGNEVVYVDGASATALPFDMFYAGQFHPPQLTARYFGLTESGWFVVVSLSGEIAVSERYLHHAYPVDNYFSVNSEQVQDMAIHMDNAYIGTNGVPYVLAMQQGDKAMQGGIVPYSEFMPCLPNTMTPAASGVIYASGQGLVALSREGMQVITKDAVNAGDTLFSKKVSNGIAIAKISNTSHGRYFAGSYYGFCQGPPIDDGVYLTTTLYPLEFSESMKADMDYGISKIIGTPVDYMVGDCSFVEASLRKILIEYDMPPLEDGSEIPDPGLHLISDFSLDEVILRKLLLATTIPPESMNISGDLVSGDLRTLLLHTDIPPEAFSITGQLISGNLFEARQATNMLPESLDISGELISGSMGVKLIPYVMEPESMQISGELISGTLT